MNKGSNQVVAVAVILVLMAGAWYAGRTQAVNSAGGTVSPEASDVLEGVSGSGSAGTGVEEDTFYATADSASVLVADQPAGTEVKVSSLILSNMGWVGVRDADGRVLGAGRFEAGSFTAVTVPLLRATVAGDSYQVLLYVDDGDRVFDLHKDILISGPDGAVAGTNFKAL